ncbi:unnamed protein product, partial [marine sediment metagenome]
MNELSLYKERLGLFNKIEKCMRRNILKIISKYVNMKNEQEVVVVLL